MEAKIESWYPHLLGYILPILAIGGLYKGGWWNATGFVFAVGIGPILDLLSPNGAPARKEGYSPTPWNALLVGHSLFAILAIATLLWRAQIDGMTLQLLMGAYSVGVVSGVSGIVNAHEQGHRRKGSFLWRMARMNLLFVLYLHFTTEHNHGHHRHYATELDPASAPKGRGLWTQIIMTLPLQFISAYKVHSSKGKGIINNPIIHGLFIQIALVGGLWWYNPVMAQVFLIQAVFAIILLEYVNYMQHYGLRREVGERHTMMHSWESRSLWSRWSLLELPLHPSHHLKASTSYQDLEVYEGSPQLPSGYYACLWLAVIPPLWKAVMDPRIPE